MRLLYKNKYFTVIYLFSLLMTTACHFNKNDEIKFLNSEFTYAESNENVFLSRATTSKQDFTSNEILIYALSNGSDSLMSASDYEGTQYNYESIADSKGNKFIPFTGLIKIPKESDQTKFLKISRCHIKVSDTYSFHTLSQNGCNFEYSEPGSTVDHEGSIYIEKEKNTTSNAVTPLYVYLQNNETNKKQYKNQKIFILAPEGFSPNAIQYSQVKVNNKPYVVGYVKTTSSQNCIDSDSNKTIYCGKVNYNGDIRALSIINISDSGYGLLLPNCAGILNEASIANCRNMGLKNFNDSVYAIRLRLNIIPKLYEIASDPKFHTVISNSSLPYPVNISFDSENAMADVDNNFRGFKMWISSIPGSAPPTSDGACAAVGGYVNSSIYVAPSDLFLNLLRPGYLKENICHLNFGQTYYLNIMPKNSYCRNDLGEPFSSTIGYNCSTIVLNKEIGLFSKTILN